MSKEIIYRKVGFLTAKNKELLANEFNKKWLEKPIGKETRRKFRIRTKKGNIRTIKRTIAKNVKNNLQDLNFVLAHWNYNYEWFLEGIPKDFDLSVRRANRIQIDDIFDIDTMEMFMRGLVFRYLLLGEKGRVYLQKLLWSMNLEVNKVWNEMEGRGHWRISLTYDSG